MTTPSNQADYGYAGLGPVSSIAESEFNSGAYQSANPKEIFSTTGFSGVYKGSLSSQGNMVAMQLNSSGYNLVPTGNQYIVDDATVIEVKPKPYATGFFRQYFKDPTKCTFGSDSPMPALTLVMPANLSDTPGNLLFYIDTQLTRVTGSNYFDTFYFINVLNQAQAWAAQSNSYLAALNQAEKTSLYYYNSKTYKDLITSGLYRYKQSSAINRAFRNIGLMLTSVPDGNFGTPNAVTKVLVNLGCGAIGGLSKAIVANNINFDNIQNPEYAPILTQILKSINNPSDLSTIQAVVESSIPRISSAYDYCSIEAASGLSNDSTFKSFQEVGEDLYGRTDSFNLTKGSEFADLLDKLQDQSSISVESLATGNALLSPEIIANLRNLLPISPSGKMISVLDIIGSAAGYLNYYFDQVNLGLSRLLATNYGPQIRTQL